MSVTSSVFAKIDKPVIENLNIQIDKFNVNVRVYEKACNSTGNYCNYTGDVTVYYPNEWEIDYAIPIFPANDANARIWHDVNIAGNNSWNTQACFKFCIIPGSNAYFSVSSSFSTISITLKNSELEPVIFKRNQIPNIHFDRITFVRSNP